MPVQKRAGPGKDPTMFEKLLKKLEPLEKGIKIPVQVELDADGYFDRRCQACGDDFKLLMEDWESKVQEERAYCPFCRREAPGTEWNTPEQAEYTKRVGVAHVQELVNEGLREDAATLRGRRGWIEVRPSVKPHAVPIIIPPDAAAVMQQPFTCEACGCRYASIGASFFCPACGHNSAPSMFDGTIETVRKIISTLPQIRAAIAEVQNDDVAQDAVRQFVEKQLGTLVTAYERFCEATFHQLPNASQFKWQGNIFQRVGDSSDLWKGAIGTGYEDILDNAELADMRRLFQQRHVLEHRQGIVDQQYVDRSGDRTYALGQRLVIREDAVLRLADIIGKIVAVLRS